MSRPEFTSPQRRRIKVLLIIRGLAGRSGGAERIFCEMAGMLAARGYDVQCLSYEGKRGAPFYPLDPRVKAQNLCHGPTLLLQQTAEAVRKGRLTRRFLNNRWRWWLDHGLFTRALRRTYKKEKPDVVISFLPPANTPALRAARGLSVKVIPTNHNVPKEDYESKKRWDQNPVDKRLRLESLSEAAAVHVLFPRFSAWFPPQIARKITAIPNYVSRAILDAAPQAAPRAPVIIAVGRLAPVKNFAMLIEAFHRIADDVPSWSLRILGQGPEEARLRAQIEAGGLVGRVIVAGHTSDIGAEYARASIYCHPALFEGFGLSAAEALAFSLPVVAFSDCAGVNEFVEDGKNGLLVARERGAAALAEALRWLIEDEPLRRRLGAAGPESVALFNEARFTDDWCRLIEHVVEEGHG